MGFFEKFRFTLVLLYGDIICKIEYHTIVFLIIFNSILYCCTYLTYNIDLADLHRLLCKICTLALTHGV